MSQFKDYFDEKYIDLKPDITQLDTLLHSDTKFLLIAGDFFGIQKFIFEQLSSKNASKVLRAKSAYIQIFTKIITYYICDKLGIEKKYILSSNAGKFEILSPVVDQEVIQEVQSELNTFFMKNFYGLSGLGLTSIKCEDTDLTDVSKYRALRDTLTQNIELSKFHKFDLTKQINAISYDTDIDNQSLCKICNIRKITHENCDLCNDFVSLGEKLTKAKQFHVCKGQGDIKVFEDYYLSFSSGSTDIVESFDITKEGKGSYNHWAISSYVKQEDGKISDFTDLANSSCDSAENGIKAIGVLKGDVDNLGTFLRDSDVTQSFNNFELFSKTMDNFFGVYVPKVLMKEKYPNTYTVFAGGDDIFLVGAWDEIIKLSIEIQKEFRTFIKDKLSISMGIIVTKASTPVSYMAQVSEEKLDEAKMLDEDKNAISLFNETVKWESYLSQREQVLTVFQEHLDLVDNTSFLYRLLELIKMRQEIEKNIENSMWKSKLNYSFRRNILEGMKNDQDATKKAEQLFKAIYEMIEFHPREAKMILSEFIYTRRKVA